MNSFQSLDQWKDYFNNPQGGKLGLLNAIQVRPAARQPLSCVSDTVFRTLARSQAIPLLPTSRMVLVGDAPFGLAPLSCCSVSRSRRPRKTWASSLELASSSVLASPSPVSNVRS